MRRGCSLFVLASVAVVLTQPRDARAFRTGGRFAQSVLEGGGGGRYFTGSPDDGHTCAVCHRGGEPPELEVEGFPVEEGYTRGAAYDLMVSIEGTTDGALALEVVGNDGAPLGELTAIEDALEPAHLCQTSDVGMPAAQELEAPAGRRVLVLDACGATRLKGRWTAPIMFGGPVYLYASAVRANASDDPTGDGSMSLVRAAPEQGGTLPGRDLDGGCSAVGGSEQSALACGLVLVMVVCRRRVGRERRCRLR